MPRPQKIPAYKLHKPSGRARVIIDGRHIYLGKFGSPESHELYARLIADYLRRKPAQRPAIASATLQLGTLTISQLILAYWTFAKTYYVLDGHPTKDFGMRAPFGLFASCLAERWRMNLDRRARQLSGST